MSEPLLSVSDVTVRFGGLKALNEVAFTVGEGEVIGLIGPNGAGKTTCFSTLVGLNRPKSGSIRFQGQEMVGSKPHRVARAGMTKTFQNTALFPGMTLYDNVLTAALGHEPLAQARETATRCLRDLHMEEAGDLAVEDMTFPQRALGEVARALATSPKLLLLDEVMAALTPAEMDEVIATILRLRDSHGIAFVVVEHHMKAIMKLSERILVLNFGELIASGTPDEISSNPAVIEAYLGAGHDD
ncbi:ABC transporter ATP-binding protein [Allosediminivita pacifica]|uniref:Amino acid/amide ABC transporter ATP-binding protein 1 (HAAT family) n=1 Tax=Allosediminivita pacifica TaxID=1267769 RepID=A0A2T6A4E3_9RHOB|nr:ABC transporter ATP-binding protein [Allosediminivita pacifica]PTX38666.1 amino acid/amide ABC transporter ATP-binding protein 1 (HAAT family) [Allosediminivita pacifica]GGB28949.1 ABC transporter ATP-binding protein [Allosediminivita pacifica]